MLTEDESNLKAIAGLAKLHVEAGDLDQAKAVLTMAAAPSPAGRGPGHRRGLRRRCASPSRRRRSAISRRSKKRSAANPDDHQARFDLALALNAKGQRDEAADALLEIVKRDRNWNDEAARKQLLQFFEAWGLMDPADGRRRGASCRRSCSDGARRGPAEAR